MITFVTYAPFHLHHQIKFYSTPYKATNVIRNSALEKENLTVVLDSLFTHQHIFYFIWMTFDRDLPQDQTHTSKRESCLSIENVHLPSRYHKTGRETRDVGIQICNNDIFTVISAVIESREETVGCWKTSKMFWRQLHQASCYITYSVPSFWHWKVYSVPLTSWDIHR